MASPWRVSEPDRADGQRRRCRTIPSGPKLGRRPLATAPACALHRPASSPEESSRFCSRLGPKLAPNRRGSLILVGPGDDRQHLETLAASLGIADRVQFTGGVNDPAEYLRAADVFVLPSVAEGMSNSLLEAMATALPCAVSGIGGNTDLIEDGKTGRLVTDATPHAWTQTLAELLDHPCESRRLGVAARRRIDDEFALSVVVDRYVALYREMLEHRWPA